MASPKRDGGAAGSPFPMKESPIGAPRYDNVLKPRRPSWGSGATPPVEEPLDDDTRSWAAEMAEDEIKSEEDEWEDGGALSPSSEDALQQPPASRSTSGHSTPGSDAARSPFGSPIAPGKVQQTRGTDSKSPTGTLGAPPATLAAAVGEGGVSAEETPGEREERGADAPGAAEISAMPMENKWGIPASSILCKTELVAMLAEALQESKGDRSISSSHSLSGSLDRSMQSSITEAIVAVEMAALASDPRATLEAMVEATRPGDSDFREHTLALFLGASNPSRPSTAHTRPTTATSARSPSPGTPGRGPYHPASPTPPVRTATPPDGGGGGGGRPGSGGRIRSPTVSSGEAANFLRERFGAKGGTLAAQVESRPNSATSRPGSGSNRPGSGRDASGSADEFKVDAQEGGTLLGALSPPVSPARREAVPGIFPGRRGWGGMIS